MKKLFGISSKGWGRGPEPGWGAGGVGWSSILILPMFLSVSTLCNIIAIDQTLIGSPGLSLFHMRLAERDKRSERRD